MFFQQYFFLTASALQACRFTYSYCAQAREIAVFTRRAVYSMINFWSHLSPSIKHLAEYSSRECQARLFPTMRPASFRGSFYRSPEGLSSCKPLHSLERISDFYLAVARSFTASKHIALAGKYTQFQRTVLRS